MHWVLLVTRVKQSMNKYWPLQKKNKKIKSKDPIYLLTRVKLNVIVYHHQYPCPQNLRPPKTIFAHRAPAQGALHCGWTPWFPGITQKDLLCSRSSLSPLICHIHHQNTQQTCLWEEPHGKFLSLNSFPMRFSEQEQLGSGIFMFTSTWHQGSFVCERASKG